MSNHLAIATVTATLNRFLQAALMLDVPGADVVMERPDQIARDENAGPRTNIFLYQVTPNASWRNEALPTRDGQGRLIQKPLAALDLHYLLSFFGDETNLLPQRMLGTAVRAFESQPVLSRAGIRATVSGGTFDFLERSDLADAVTSVKLMPVALSLEELSKLWSVFFQTPYVLSVAYQATVVLIEGLDAPTSPLPVGERRLWVVPFQPITVEAVTPEDGPVAPIQPGSALRITGSGLGRTGLRVRVDGVTLLPERRPEGLRVVLEHEDLRVGIRQLWLEAPLPAGEANGGGNGMGRVAESNRVPIVLRPVVTEVTETAGDQGERVVNVTLSLTVGAKQKVSLILNGLEGDNPAFTLELPDREDDGTILSTPVGTIPGGPYLVRVRVDGADSLPHLAGYPGEGDPQRYADPLVELSAPPTPMIAEVSLAFRERRNRIEAEATVRITDLEGGNLARPLVRVLWHLPDGTEVEDEKTANNAGRAVFTQSDDSGDYTVTVVRVEKAGFVFNPTGGTPSVTEFGG